MSDPLPLFTKALADSWRSTLGWAAGLTVAALLYLPLYPSIGGSAEMQQLIDALPPALVRSLNYDQIASGPGYTGATLFGLIGYLLMSIATVGWGAAAVGADEETGRLELTLAHGTTRVQVVLERALALLVRVTALSALVLVLVLALNGPAQLDIAVPDLAGTVLLFGGLALLSGTAALAGGALSGRRSVGLGAGAAVAVLGYVFNALANQSEDLRWLGGLSPYSWAYADSPLSTGAHGWAVVALYGLSAALIAVAAAALQHRDVGTRS